MIPRAVIYKQGMTVINLSWPNSASTYIKEKGLETQKQIQK